MDITNGNKTAIAELFVESVPNVRINAAALITPMLVKGFGFAAAGACVVMLFAAIANLLPRAHRCRIAAPFKLPCNQTAERRRMMAATLAIGGIVAGLVANAALKRPNPAYVRIEDLF